MNPTDKITINSLKTAYSYLKNYAYYDNSNYFLKNRLASFEDQDLDDILDLLLVKLNSGDLEEEIEQIRFHVVPKSFKESSSDDEGLLRNYKDESDEIKVDRVSLFIDAPIEIHLIGVLWCIYVGKHLVSDEIYSNCFGNKIISKEKSLFAPYYNQYKLWRDRALMCAENALELKQDVAIVSLDIKDYYYNVRINIEKECKIDNNCNIANTLNKLLQLIHKRYQASILENKELAIIFNLNNNKSQKYILPIGLLSSAVLANFCLHDIDNKIVDTLQPIYYGRYVDDLLLVVRNNRKINDRLTFLEEFFKEKLKCVFPNRQDDTSFLIKGVYGVFPIQEEKTNIWLLRHDSSRAIIRNFLKEIAKNSSEFRFLPDEDILDEEFDNVVYELNYSGSHHKIRNVVSISNKLFSVSKFLSKKILASQYSDEIVDIESSKQIISLFSGISNIEMKGLWAKVITYFLVNNQLKYIFEFVDSVKADIDKIIHERSEITRLIKKSLHVFIEGPLAQSLALVDDNIKVEAEKYSSSDLILSYRNSLLFRHDLVLIPNIFLINAAKKDRVLWGKNLLMISTEDIEALTNEDWEYNQNDFKIPTHLKPHDFSILEFYKALITNDKQFFENDIPNYSLTINDNISYIEEANKSDSTEFTVAIANIKLPETNLIENIKNKPILNRSRRKELFDLFNTAIDEKVDLLVFPECAIPYSWFNLLIKQSHKHNLAIITGLEHITLNRVAYNALVTILPIVSNNGLISSYVKPRIKKYYSPREIELLRGYRLNIPESDNQLSDYDLFTWRGVSFTSYNCFELANIEDRSLFKGKVDFITASLYNKDLLYYSDIIGTVARDLHSFVIQVNTSQYGDSRIMQPASSDIRDVVQIKGGENSVLLKTTLNIKELREFQLKEWNLQLLDKRFKPTPPDFDKTLVQKRIDQSR